MALHPQHRARAPRQAHPARGRLAPAHRRRADLPDPARGRSPWAWCRSWTRERVLLVRQFRHLARADSWELPGGGALPGESPEAAAQRELREEGGYRAGRLTFLTRFLPSAAYLDETAYCFIGEDLVADPLASDDDEFFERRAVPFREAVAMALDDRITESVSKLALLAAALRLGLRPDHARAGSPPQAAPAAAREAYSLYVERAARRNEADGPFQPP